MLFTVTNMACAKGHLIVCDDERSRMSKPGAAQDTNKMLQIHAPFTMAVMLLLKSSYSFGSSYQSSVANTTRSSTHNASNLSELTTLCI